MNGRLLLMMGSIMAFLGVAIGAFGAHALKQILTANQRSDVFDTAVKYQFYHSFALILTGVLYYQLPDIKWLNYAGICFLSGILLFSGSLYILSITNATKWGAVTPFGGIFFMAGWVFCIVAIYKSPL